MMGGSTQWVPTTRWKDRTRSTSLSFNECEDAIAAIRPHIDLTIQSISVSFSSQSEIATLTEEPEDVLFLIREKLRCNPEEQTSSSFGSLLRFTSPDKLTENDLRDLSEKSPNLLHDYIAKNLLRTVQLAHAATFLGMYDSTSRTTEVLLKLLDHKNPLVREGVVYGLGNIGTTLAINQLRNIAVHDSSPGVREAAKELLETE